MDEKKIAEILTPIIQYSTTDIEHWIILIYKKISENLLINKKVFIKNIGTFEIVSIHSKFISTSVNSITISPPENTIKFISYLEIPHKKDFVYDVSISHLQLPNEIAEQISFGLHKIFEKTLENNQHFTFGKIGVFSKTKHKIIFEPSYWIQNIVNTYYNQFESIVIPNSTSPQIELKTDSAIESPFIKAKSILIPNRIEFFADKQFDESTDDVIITKTSGASNRSSVRKTPTTLNDTKIDSEIESYLEHENEREHLYQVNEHDERNKKTSIEINEEDYYKEEEKSFSLWKEIVIGVGIVLLISAGFASYYLFYDDVQYYLSTINGDTPVIEEPMKKSIQPSIDKKEIASQPLVIEKQEKKLPTNNTVNKKIKSTFKTLSIKKENAHTAKTKSSTKKLKESNPPKEIMNLSNAPGLATTKSAGTGVKTSPKSIYFNVWTIVIYSSDDKKKLSLVQPFYARKLKQGEFKQPLYSIFNPSDHTYQLCIGKFADQDGALELRKTLLEDHIVNENAYPYFIER